MDKIFVLYCLMFMVLSQPINFQIDETITKYEQFQYNLSQNSQNYDVPSYILMSWISINTFIFIVVCLCSIKYKFSLNSPRAAYNNKFPNRKFVCNSGCSPNTEQFYSVDCFYPNERLTVNPAYVIDSILFAGSNEHKGDTIESCKFCRAETQSIVINKIGKQKLDHFNTIIYVVVFGIILPLLFVAKCLFNSVLWEKLFCMICGKQKEKTSNQIIY